MAANARAACRYNRVPMLRSATRSAHALTAMAAVAYLCASVALAAGPAAAAGPATTEAETAHGTFKSHAITLEVRSAIAFHGKSSLGGPDDVVIVAATNAKVHGGALADYYDRRRAAEKRIKDDETGVVYFEFRPDGRYKGLSYYFASGNGCGRNVPAKQTHSSEPERTFEVTLDVPVMSDDHGTALPVDGGAPGAAYLAYHAALGKRDRAALKASLSLDRQQAWNDAEKKGSVGGFVDFLAGEHPNQSVRIVRGFVKGNTAVLLVSGESSTIGALNGEVLLMKEKDVWHVDDELMDLVLR